jgi:hypothetical protein
MKTNKWGMGMDVFWSDGEEREKRRKARFLACNKNIE